MRRRGARSSRSGPEADPIDREEVEWDHGPPDRAPRSQNRDQYSRPYDQWSPSEYVFYAGQGYHRGFYDPFAGEHSSDESPRRRYSGLGPRGYRRSDARIQEDVSERLTFDGEVDATEIEVRVEEGEVTLEGSVGDRPQKRRAEDLAGQARGVRDVHNRLRVAAQPPKGRSGRESGAQIQVQGNDSHSGSGFLTDRGFESASARPAVRAEARRGTSRSPEPPGRSRHAAGPRRPSS